MEDTFFSASWRMVEAGSCRVVEVRLVWEQAVRDFFSRIAGGDMS